MENQAAQQPTQAPPASNPTAPSGNKTHEQKKERFTRAERRAFAKEKKNNVTKPGKKGKKDLKGAHAVKGTRNVETMTEQEKEILRKLLLDKLNGPSKVQNTKSKAPERKTKEYDESLEKRRQEKKKRRQEKRQARLEKKFGAKQTEQTEQTQEVQNADGQQTEQTEVVQTVETQQTEQTQEVQKAEVPTQNEEEPNFDDIDFDDY